MPKYAKPLKGGSHARRFSHFTPVAGATTTSSSTSIENLSKAASTVGAGAGGGSISGKKNPSNRLFLLIAFPVNCQKCSYSCHLLIIKTIKNFLSTCLRGENVLLIMLFRTSIKKANFSKTPPAKKCVMQIDVFISIAIFRVVT